MNDIKIEWYLEELEHKLIVERRPLIQQDSVNILQEAVTVNQSEISIRMI